MWHPDLLGRKEPNGAVPLESLKQRSSRTWALEQLLGLYARSDDDGLRTVLTNRLRVASQRLGAFEIESTFADPRLMSRYALNLLDLANWKDQVVTLADGSSHAISGYVSPKNEADHIERLQAESSNRFTEMNITSLLYSALDDPSRSSPELAERGVAWAKEALSVALDEDDDETLRNNAIRAAALIALRDGGDDVREKHAHWAEQVLMNAKTASDNGSSRMRRELSFNPLATAFVGITELYRRAPTPARLRALLEIATDDNPAGAPGFARVVSALAAADERIPKAIIRCALAGVRRPVRDWKLSKEETLARASRLQAAKSKAVDEELDWIEGTAPEPAWPDLTIAYARSRVRPRRYIRIGTGATAAPAMEVGAEPDVLIDDQAAGMWLEALDPLLDVDSRPWVRDLAAEYGKFSAQLNGFGRDQHDETTQPASEWNGSYYRLLAYAIVGLSDGAIDELALQGILPLPDEPFFDVASHFLRAVDVIYFNTQRLKNEAPRIRQRIAMRLSSSWNWRREIGSRSGSVERHLASCLATIFFNDYTWVGPPTCYLVPKSMDHVAPFLPTLVLLLESGPGYFLASVTLNWLEISPREFLVPVLTTSARAWLTRYDDDTGFWISQGIGTRVCSWLETMRTIAPELFTAGTPARTDVEHIVASLVRLGIPEAHQLESRLARAV